MYTTFDTRTALTYARLHQDDVRAAFPRRRPRWWRRETTAPPRPAPTRLGSAPEPAHHHPAAA